MKGSTRASSQFLLIAVALCGALPLFASSITYTCDSTIGSLDGAGVCGYLNSTVAGLYSSTFSNANANIYVTTSSTGLGESTQVTQLVTYSQYYSALQALALQPGFDTTAFNSLSVSDPAIFTGGSTFVGITAALTNALGISGGATFYGAIYGVTPGSPTPCILGSSNCYNGVIQVVTPAGLSSGSGGSQGLWYRNVAGTASGAQPGNDYDFFSVVEHETDELLGTASCTDITSLSPTGGTPDAFTGGPSGPPTPATNECTASGQITASPSAVDLFRYSAPGARVFDSLTAAYFSPDGGTTDTDGNAYNTTNVGEDYADFSQSCTFVQDAEGCLGGSFDIITDNGGGPGPEISILNAVGYDLNQQGPVTTPEPASMILFGTGLAGLMARMRRKKN